MRELDEANTSTMEAEVFGRRVRAFVYWWHYGPPPAPNGASPRDAEIIRLFTRKGYSMTAIAPLVGVSTPTVRNVLRSHGIDTARLPICETFGRIIGRDPSAISKWRTGTDRIPVYVWRFLNALNALAEVGGREAVRYAIMDSSAEPVVDAERVKALGLRA